MRIELQKPGGARTILMIKFALRTLYTVPRIWIKVKYTLGFKPHN